MIWSGSRICGNIIKFDIRATDISNIEMHTPVCVFCGGGGQHLCDD